MSNISIKKASNEDIVQLQKIAISTFSETFSEFNTPENLNKYLSKSFSIEQLNSELNNTHSEFYLAIDDTTPIGYLKVNFGSSQTELKDNKALEIERIYVLKQCQGKSVGQMLYQKAIDIANQNKVEYIWLGVWEKNTRAISFYKKNGFVTFDTHIFKMGDEEQTDFMMKLKLINDQK